jgi:hypothetical protein
MESAGQLREDVGVSCPCRRRPVEALKLKTLDDLFLSQDERVGPVGGEIVRRPMVWFITHGRAQTRTALALRTFGEGEGSGGGWWFATEVSVAYETHECPSHDLAGWRRERTPRPPDGVIDLPPETCRRRLGPVTMRLTCRSSTSEPATTDWKDRIAVDPDILVGKPIVRGTRISVELLMDRLGDGYTGIDDATALTVAPNGV